MRWVALALLLVGTISAAGMVTDYLWANRRNEHTATSWAILISAVGIGVYIGMYALDGLLDRGANSGMDWWEMGAAGLLGTAMFPTWWLIMRRERRHSRKADRR